ncbi:efflux RND transporter periplasmic adaptor subunit [candidate division KSB1 bacterium]|nr:efflux RND transporter periplasmic adaptor subunit [candidate division KSB1 bacterium]
MQLSNTFFVVVFAFVLTACSKQKSEEHEQASAEDHGAESTVVTLNRQQLSHIRLETAPVEENATPIVMTLPGKVMLNERRRAEITARLAGRVEKISAFAGDRVAAGQALAEIFSQEFLAMQMEYLQAIERAQRFNIESSDQSTAKTILLSARRKLEVAGLREVDLRELETGKEPMSHLHIRAPFTGAVLNAEVVQGQFVEFGAHLFEIADLSTLWILADIYEQDLPRVHKGMKAQVEVTPYPREMFPATLAEIFDVVDAQTRTVKARLEVQNPSGKLKPEMFASVHLTTELGGSTIKVPASAMLGETEKHFVFVAVNDSTFEKREVRTGAETREIVEVLDGLATGERIVTRGGFFLKSELAKETFGEEH